MPKWSILIATVGERNKRFLKLLDRLMSQVAKYKGEIQVLAYWNNAERPLGEIRQALVEEATGEYVSFIDDDDSIPSYYCDKVYENLGKDYVGWRMQVWHNGTKLKPTFHSIKYPRWYEDDKGYYRNVSHLNPIKRSIALRVSFVAEGIAEDQPWSIQIAPLVKSENYIPEVMYFYNHSTKDSIWRGNVSPIFNVKRPVIRRKYFAYHSKSFRRLVDGNPSK